MSVSAMRWKQKLYRRTGRIVGLDMGVLSRIALSDGSFIDRRQAEYRYGGGIFRGALPDAGEVQDNQRKLCIANLQGCGIESLCGTVTSVTG